MDAFILTHFPLELILVEGRMISGERKIDEHDQMLEKKYLKMQTKRNRYGGNREKGQYLMPKINDVHAFVEKQSNHS